MKASCHNSTTILLILLSFLCLMPTCPIATACASQDEVVVAGEHITGQIASQTRVTYLLDMPIPQAPYPAQKLTVSYRRFTECEILAALTACGQGTDGEVHLSDTDFRYDGNWDAQAYADISPEEAAAQAVAIGLAFFDALGVSVECEPKSIGRPYEFDDSNQRYWTFVSEPQAYSDYYRSQFDSPRRQRTRPRHSEYTSVEFAVLLDGMRMIDNPSYPAGYADEPDALIGFSVTARVIVSDSGLLVEADASDIPFVVARESIDPLPDWESYLRSYVKSLTAGENSYKEYTYWNENIGKEVTVYATQPVVTSVFPRLKAVSQYEWIPTWVVEIDEILAEESLNNAQ